MSNGDDNPFTEGPLDQLSLWEAFLLSAPEPVATFLIAVSQLGRAPLALLARILEFINDLSEGSIVLIDRFLDSPGRFVRRFVVGVIIGIAVSVAGLIRTVFEVLAGTLTDAFDQITTPFDMIGSALIGAIVTVNQSVANQVGPALGIGAAPIIVTLVLLELFGLLRLSAPVLRIVASAVEVVPVVGPTLSTAIVALLELVGLIVDVLPFGGES